MHKLLITIAGLCSASIAQATTINFESGYPDPVYYSTFSDSGATFTALGSTTLLGIGTFGGPWGTAGPHILCPYTPAGTYCSGSFQVAFANPVTNLQFYFTGDNTTTALSVEAFLNGSSLGTLTAQGDGVTTTAKLVNLSSFGQISSIKVTGSPTDGFGYDDFSFIAVPEPSTWAMMLLGFGAIGVAVRRRNRSLRRPFAA